MRDIFILIFLLGCTNGEDPNQKVDFKKEYQNCLMWIVHHQKETYQKVSSDFEVEQFARSVDFLVEASQIKSNVEGEPPFFYFSDSTLIDDLNNWMDWYNSSSKETKENALERIKIKKLPFPEEFFKE